jgi:hypothetical protein
MLLLLAFTDSRRQGSGPSVAPMTCTEMLVTSLSPFDTAGRWSKRREDGTIWETNWIMEMTRIEEER